MGAYEVAILTVTTVTVPNVSGAAGQTVALSGTLKTAGGTALSARTLTFSLDGTTLGTAVTGSNGTIARAYTIPPPSPSAAPTPSASPSPETALTLPPREPAL